MQEKQEKRTESAQPSLTQKKGAGYRGGLSCRACIKRCGPKLEDGHLLEFVEKKFGARILQKDDRQQRSVRGKKRTIMAIALNWRGKNRTARSWQAIGRAQKTSDLKGG